MIEHYEEQRAGHRDNLVSAICNEPHGDVEHHVTQMPLTLGNLYSFWEKARKYPTLFGIKVSEDFGQFCSIFISKDSSDIYTANGLVWVIDDLLGVFYMTDIYAPDDAMVHFTFLDGRIRGRVPLVKAMLHHVFERYQFRRLSAMIPMYAVTKGYKTEKIDPTATGVFKFVEDCGFKKEGRKRKCAPYKDDYFDAIMYGILREEFNGR